MIKRTMFLLVLVLLLSAVSDWQHFKDRIRPIVKPISQWAERQLDDEGGGADRTTELDRDRHTDDETSFTTRIEGDHLAAPGASVFPNERPHPPAPNTLSNPDKATSDRLASLREQLHELNAKASSALDSRLQWIDTELENAERQLETFQRQSHRGNSPELETKIRLAHDRAAQLRTMRNQLLSTGGK